MSEAEISDRMILIINGYKECLDYNCNQTQERQRQIKYDIKTLEAMIDLYNKEEEKNKELQKYMKENLIPKSTINLVYISKDKIREKIESLEDYIKENSDEQGYWGSEHQEDIYAKIEILEELLGDK